MTVITRLVSRWDATVRRDAIEVIDDAICDDAIVVELADDGHPTDLVVPAAAIGKRIPVQGYIDQATRDFAPLASALQRYVAKSS